MTWLFTALIANTVIGIVLAGIAFLANRCGKPALAHVIWLLVILKLITPPMVRMNVWKRSATATNATAVASTPQIVAAARRDDAASPRTSIPFPDAEKGMPARATGGPNRNAALDAFAHTAVLDRMIDRMNGISISAVLAVIWCAGSLIYLGVVGARVRRFCDLLKHAAPAERGIVERVRVMSGTMGIARMPQVCIVSAAVSPLVFALRRTILVLPQSVVERLSIAQQRAVIAHELAHLRRGDHYVRWIEILATTLLWWHPLLWLARHGLHEAEEQCCDAWVVATMAQEQHPHGRREYADALVGVLELTCLSRGGAELLSVPAGASGLGRMTNLKRRLAMILADRTPEKAMSRGAKLAVLLLAAAVLLLTPVRAEDRHAKPASTESAAATAPAVVVDESTRKAVESLLDAAQDPDEQVRNAAREAIVRFGGKGVPVLLDAMGREKTAELASQLLPAVGVEGAEALIQAIDSTSPAVRERAMVTLRMMIAPQEFAMEGAPPGAPGFAPGADPSAPGVPGAPPPAAPTPVGFVPPVAGGVTRFGYAPASPQGINIAQWLIAPATRASTDSNVAVRRAAIQLLGASARLLGDPALIQPLTGALKDKDATVRLLAAQSLIALARTSTPGLASALASAAQDSDASVRVAALAALGSMGPAASEAMPVVTAALRDSNAQVRGAAATALGLMQALAADQSQAPPGAGAPSLFGGGGGGGGGVDQDLQTAAGNVWHWNKVGRNDLAGKEARGILQAKPKADDFLFTFAQTAASRGANLATWIKSIKDVPELKDLAEALTRAKDSAAQPENHGRPVEY